MRVQETEALVEKCLEKRRKLLLVGPPGIGKTELVSRATKRRGADLLPICAPLTDPSFWLGYPFRENGSAGHLPYGVIAKALEAKTETTLLVDEIGGVSETTSKAILRFIQFGEVGHRRLPDCVTIMAASNDVGHGAGVMGLIEPLKDRFASIVNVEPHIDDTVDYGLANGWPADLIAFLRNSSPTDTAPHGALLDWKPNKSMQSGGSTPRGWGEVAGLVNDGCYSVGELRDLVCGKVGKGRGTEYLSFRDLVSELPDVASILMSPDTAPVPDKPDFQYFVMVALSGAVTASNWGRAMTYLQRFKQTFRCFCLKSAFHLEQSRQRDKALPANYVPLAHAKGFASWATGDDGKAILGASSR